MMYLSVVSRDLVIYHVITYIYLIYNMYLIIDKYNSLNNSI